MRQFLLQFPVYFLQVEKSRAVIETVSYSLLYRTITVHFVPSTVSRSIAVCRGNTAFQHTVGKVAAFQANRRRVFKLIRRLRNVFVGFLVVRSHSDRRFPHYKDDDSRQYEQNDDYRQKMPLVIRIIRLSAKGTNEVMKRRDANASKFCYTIHGKVR